MLVCGNSLITVLAGSKLSWREMMLEVCVRGGVDLLCTWDIVHDKRSLMLDEWAEVITLISSVITGD